MQTVLIALATKLIELIFKYLIAWGEASIRKQQEMKEKMEAYQASKKEAIKAAEAYEQNPSDVSRDNLP